MKFTEEQKANLEKQAVVRGMKLMKLADLNNGASGIFWHKRNNTGAFTPQPGYYLIEEVPPFALYADTGESICGEYKANSASVVELNCRDHRELKRPIYAKYNANSFEYFSDEIVLVEGKFLYNKNSTGPKRLGLKSGMILHVENAELVKDSYNGKEYDTYSISWKVHPHECGI